MTNAVRLIGKVLPAVVFGVLFLGTWEWAVRFF
jgi:branched-subunit amino acid transport protein AzlD